MSTWHKASFGVYDFSPTNNFITTSHFIARQSGTFVLDFYREKVFELDDPNLIFDSNSHKKFTLDLNSNCLIDFENSPKLSESLWIPIINGSHRLLKIGDIIRFGKQQLTLTAMNLHGKIDSKQQALIENLNTSVQIPKKNANISYEKSIVCRICLESNISDNPFIDICFCSKTMPMHLSCVREWMKRKCEKSEKPNVVFFNLSEVNCEVCQQEYPAKVTIQNQTHMLFEPKIDESRRNIVFNIIDKKKFEVKGYVILYFDGPKAKFTVGRTDENDITFEELSISRTHSELSVSKEGLKLVDLKSKYGTHVKCRRLDFSGNNIFYLQIDKFLFEFHPFVKNQCFCPSTDKLFGMVEKWKPSQKQKNVNVCSKYAKTHRSFVPENEKIDNLPKKMSIREQFELLRLKTDVKQVFKKNEHESDYIIEDRPFDTEENIKLLEIGGTKEELALLSNGKKSDFNINDFECQQKTPFRRIFAEQDISKVKSYDSKMSSMKSLVRFMEDPDLMIGNSSSKKGIMKISFQKKLKSNRVEPTDDSVSCFVDNSQISFNFN